jgi:NAD(P)-dependent dehydrogenase (short-subunit alcohol dehydrogenase family)
MEFAMDLQLAGDVAVVFGAARGIGRAIAAAFVAEGVHVVLADVAPDVTATAQQLGQTARAERVDATDFAAVCAVADRTRADFRRVDHVVYAVGIGSGKFGFPFWNLEPADWDRVLRVNLIGAVVVAQAFAPAMAADRRGTLLFLSSVAGQIGSQTDPPYSAAKAGLINFAQCAARDLAPHGVRVNVICPGMVRTELNRSVWQAWADRQPPSQRLAYEEWAGEKVRRLVPLGRWQTPEDIAAMAVFLASPRAGNVTGQTINVDGGYVMH